LGHFTCCNGTYRRHDDGTWHYAWGEEVPRARDLTVAGALGIALSPEGTLPPSLSQEELTRVAALCGVDEPLLVHRADGRRQLIIGMDAPELNALTMLTVADIGDLADVSKATIDSYRYRGYLPEPQVVKGRTPLWSRPVVRRWLATRPGAGWRTDVYGSRERRAPDRALPITRVREAAAQRRRLRETTPNGS
jgi:hypothetical protein